MLDHETDNGPGEGQVMAWNEHDAHADGDEHYDVEPGTMPWCKASTAPGDETGSCAGCGLPVVTIGWEEKSQFCATVHRHQVEAAYRDHGAHYDLMPARLAELTGHETWGAMDVLLGPLAEPRNGVGTDDRRILQVIVTEGSEPGPVMPGSPQVSPLSILHGQLRALKDQHGDLPDADVARLVTNHLASYGYEL